MIQGAQLVIIIKKHGKALPLYKEGARRHLPLEIDALVPLTLVLDKLHAGIDILREPLGREDRQQEKGYKVFRSQSVYLCFT
jgi:hypothetical protein